MHDFVADPGHLSIRIKHIVVGQLTAVVTAPKSRSSAGWFSLQFNIEETGFSCRTLTRQWDNRTGESKIDVLKYPQEDFLKRRINNQDQFNCSFIVFKPSTTNGIVLLR
ncbi:hypothetical protein NQ317_001451 [Molorchus minor]|uniref:Uncharacterized protein n=1 Tax=Molorchus minor TaxID=1323400 RepID=A0ABQ9JL92_9CUCU|nr:hypothetical protein NQ317_001451 [Molorchus minor]